MTNREKLVELLTSYYGVDPAYYDVDAPSIADHLLANGVVVREKGEWMEMVDCVEDGYTGEYYEEIYYNCLNCDYATSENTPFCPNCGADMTGGDRNV